MECRWDCKILLRARDIYLGKPIQNLGSGARGVKEYWDDCQYFHDQGARCIIFTMGQDGAIASVRERSRSNRPRVFYSGALVAPSPATVKDTTGASDAGVEGAGG